MEKQLKVLLLNDSFPPLIDGVGNTVLNYARILPSLGTRLVVAVPEYKGVVDDYPFPVVRYPSFNTVKLVGYRTGYPFDTPTLNNLKNENFDVIHSHCPFISTMLARTLREMTGAPIIFTYHTKFDIDIRTAIRAKILQEAAIKIIVDNISACDEVWVVSRGAGENLRSLGFEGDYIVMPNGVDFPRGRVDQRLIDEVTAPFDLPAGVPVFLFVGRMMWYKGIRIILDALKTLREAGQDFRMVFVGGGGDREEIAAYTEELALSDRVFFAEPIHDRARIRAWYCRADLFLFPSTFDTNGLVVHEAAACVLASVLIAGSCAAEDTVDGVSGFLIEENAASMAAKLLELCRTPEIFKTVGEGAQRDLYISWDEAVQRAAARYEVVIENYRAGKYPRHTGLSDDLIHSIAASMDDFNRSRERQRARMRELTESTQKLVNELRNEGQRRLGELQNLGADFEHEQSRITAEVKTRFDEQAKYWDRFM